jgi:hypothetical protein
MIAITTAKLPNIRRPGRIPARNMSLTGICASTAKMTNSIEGGITGASNPPAAVEAAAKPRSYPSASIAGTMARDMMAIWLAAEPTMAAMNMLATRLIHASPPRNPPTKTRAAAIRRLVTPPSFINSPVSMKSGIASSP